MKDPREILKTAIGANIRTCRETREMSLRELSRLLDNKSPSSLSNIENGKNLPDIDTVFKICKLLKVEIIDILPDPQVIMVYKAKKTKTPEKFKPKDKTVQFKNKPYAEEF